MIARTLQDQIDSIDTAMFTLSAEPCTKVHALWNKYLTTRQEYTAKVTAIACIQVPFDGVCHENQLHGSY